MFGKISDAAEKLATSVSRRHFLGSLGRWAGATALAMAGALTTAGTSRAGVGKTCCFYFPLYGGKCLGAKCVDAGQPCPIISGLGVSSVPISSCGQCKCKGGVTAAVPQVR
jgi:hypothetical protein